MEEKVKYLETIHATHASKNWKKKITKSHIKGTTIFAKVQYAFCLAHLDLHFYESK